MKHLIGLARLAGHPVGWLACVAGIGFGLGVVRADFPTGWGRDDFGQVGLVPASADLIALDGGNAHVLGIDRAGKVVGWGLNDFGQAAPPSDLGTVVAVSAGYTHSLALRSDGTVRAWGSNAAGQAATPSDLGTAQAVAAGWFHSLALRRDGTVVAWGGNPFGESTVPPELSGVRAIAAGAHHSLAVTDTGEVRVWGFESHGLHQPPAGLDHVRTVASGFHHSLALREDGTVVGWGYNGDGQATVPEGLSNVVAVAAGFAHSVALRADGSVVMWGRAEGGERTSRVRQGRTSAVAAGAGFTFVLTPGPVITQQPVDMRLVPGAPAILSSAAVGREPLRFQWEHRGVPLFGATSATLRLDAATQEAEGEYRVVVSNPDGVIESRVARLLSPPVIETQPGSLVIFAGEMTTLKVGAAGTPPLSYQWWLGTNRVVSGTNDSLTQATAWFEAISDYRVVVSNAWGAVTSQVARVESVARPVPLISGPPVPIAYDETIPFGQWQANDRWEFNGQPAPGLDPKQTSFAHARPSDSGRYRVVVVTRAGEVASEEVTVTVKPLTRVEWVGRRVELDAGTGWGTVRAWQWQRDGQILPGATNAVLGLAAVRPEDAGRYTARLTDAVGEREVEVGQLAVLPAPGVGGVVVWGANAHLYGGVSNLQNVIELSYHGERDIQAVRADGQRISLVDGAPAGGGSAPAERVVGTASAPTITSDYTEVFGDGHASGITFGACGVCFPPLAESRFVGVAHSYESALGLRLDGTVVVWGVRDPDLVRPAGLSDVKAVAGGHAHFLALRRDGTLVAWGRGEAAAVPAGLGQIRAIAAGRQHNLALREDGSVVAWGDNSRGQCDVPAGLTGARAIFAGGDRNYVVRADGSLVGWGGIGEGKLAAPEGLRGVQSMLITYYADFAVVGEDDAPAVWEQPVSMERELGGTARFSVSAWSTRPLTYQWQRGDVDLLGATNATLELRGLQASDAGDYRVVVKAGNSEQASQRATLWVNPPPYLSSPDRVGQVVLWGPGIGVGRSNLVSIPDLVSVQSFLGRIGLFRRDAWVLQVDATRAQLLEPVGAEGAGIVQLAYVGGFESRVIGLQANGNARVLGGPIPAGINYDRLRWIAGLRGLRQIASQNGPFIALRRDGTILHDAAAGAFPTNLTGVVAVAATGVHLAVLRSDGTVISSRLDSQNEDPVPMPVGLDRVVAISGGGNHLLALRDDGRVAAWGENQWGQCEVPVGLAGVTQISAGDAASLALRADHTVVAWGDAGMAPSSTLSPPTNVLVIASGGPIHAALVAGPLVTLPPEDVIVRLGESAEFALAASAPGPIRCEWFHEGVRLEGQTNLQLRLSSVRASDAGRYEAVLESDGFEVRQTARLMIGPAPELTQRPSDTDVREGEAWTLAVRVEPAEGANYTWSKDGRVLTEAHGPSYGQAAAALADHGHYQVRVTMASGHAFELGAQLRVVRRQRMGNLLRWGPGSWPIPSLSGVVSLSLGGRHGVALLADGTVRAWGDNDRGQATVPDGLEGVVAIAAGAAHTLALRHDGSVRAWGDRSYLQTFVPDRRDFVAVAAGGFSSLGLTRDGQVVAWGLRGFGRERVPEAATNVTAIAAGDGHALALRADGVVVAWGNNDLGQATPPPASNHDVRAVWAGGSQSAFIDASGKLVVFGADFSDVMLPPVDLPPVESVAAGPGHVLVLLRDGTVRGWGRGSIPQVPLDLRPVIAVAAGYETSLTVVEDGLFFARQPESRAASAGDLVELKVAVQGDPPLQFQWLKDQLLVAGAVADTLVFPSVTRSAAGRYQVQVQGPRGMALSEIATLSVMDVPRIARLPRNTLAWQGAAVRWEPEITADAAPSVRWLFLGGPIPGLDGSGTFLELPAVTRSQAGEYSVTASNRWGVRSASVALEVLESPPAVLRPQAGASLRLAVSGGPATGLEYAWFKDGQVIPGATTSVYEMSSIAAPGGVFTVRVRWREGSELEASTRVEVAPPETRIVKPPHDLVLRPGDEAQFEVEATGELPLSYRWRFEGQDLVGAVEPLLRLPQVDLSRVGRYSVVVSNRLGVVESDPARLEIRLGPNVVAWGTNQNGVLNVPTDLTNAVAVAASEHGLALTDDGRVVAWGANDFGQANVPAGLGKAVAVAAGATHSVALLADGRVAAWGDNRRGQTDVPAGATNVVAVASSVDHSLALRSDGTLVGWGPNTYGQSQPPSFGFPRATAVAASRDTSVALLTNTTVKSWGAGFVLPTSLSNIVQLAAGPSRMLALRSDGVLFGWAEGNSSSPRVEEVTAPAVFASGLWISNRLTSIVRQSHEIAASKSGQVSVWGVNPAGIFTPPIGLSNVAAVAAGRWQNLAVVRAPQILRQPQGGVFVPGSRVRMEVVAVGDGPHSFQWELDGADLAGATNAVLEIAALELAQMGRYTVRVQGKTFAARSVPTEVWGDVTAPQIVTGPRDANAEVGGTARWAVRAIGRPPLRYLWFHNGRRIEEAAGPEWLVSGVTAADAGLYQVRVENDAGSATSAPFALALKPEDLAWDDAQASVEGEWTSTTAGFPYGPDSLSAPAGSGLAEVEFHARLPRPGRWRVSCRFASFSGASRMMPVRVRAESGVAALWVAPIGGGRWQTLGEYRFGADASVAFLDAIADPDRQAVADAVRFEYLPDPPRLVAGPLSQSVAEGDAVAFEVVATGAAPLQFQWQREGANLPGALGASLAWGEVTAADAGVYRVIVANLDGALLSDQATLRVSESRPTLGWQTAGASLLLEWSSPVAVLQSSGDASGPYLDVPGSASPFRVDLRGEPRRFYRLRGGAPAGGSGD